MKRKKRILIAPLDWGLGHATRCIPIIYGLKELGAEIIIGTNGQALQLLQTEFPDIEFNKLPGYNIKYGKKFNISIARQLPKLFAKVSSEHILLQRWIKTKKLNAVISDNRFGLWTKKIPCVFITHQVRIIMPENLSRFERMIFLLNRSFISKYNELWIPDFKDGDNLSGRLAHHISVYNETHYLGPLSRLHACSSLEKRYDIAVILSGPEPHRTKLEKKLIDQLKDSKYKAIIIQGKPETIKKSKVNDAIELVSYLNSSELNEVICSSSIVISRSGYSTVMDMASTGAKAIFIPTPGQTEQEYLANELKRKRLFYYEQQDDFSLERAIIESKNYTGLQIKTDSGVLKNFLAKWLDRI